MAAISSPIKRRLGRCAKAWGGDRRRARRMVRRFQGVARSHRLALTDLSYAVNVDAIYLTVHGAPFIEDRRLEITHLEIENNTARLLPLVFDARIQQALWYA